MLVFFVGREIFTGRTGFWSAVSYALLPGVSLSSMVVSTDVYLLFFWAAALFALMRAEKTDHLSWWFVFGAALGMGFLSKYAMVFFFLCLVVDSLWRTCERPVWSRSGFWIALALAVLIYLPNFIWNWGNGFPSYIHTGDNINIGGDILNPIKALEFFGSQFGVFGPILFGAYIYFVVRVFVANKAGHTPSDSTRWLLSYSLPIIFLISIEALLTRAHANWAATAYVAATLFVVNELLSLKRLTLLKASLAVHVFAAIVLYNFDLIARTFDIPITPDLDPARRMRGWDHAGNWATDLQSENPGVRFLFDDRKVMSAMVYYTRPHPFESVMWNPTGKRNNHFELTTDLSNATGQDFLYIMRHDVPDRAGRAFSESRLLATFRSRSYSGDALELKAYILRDFQGYK